METFVTAAAAIVVAIIEAFAARDRALAKKESARLEARAQRREEAEHLALEMQYATMQLSIVSANALTGGHNNGNVLRARDAAEAVMLKYDAFIKATATHAIYKS